jgi:hypothetical protein
VEDLMARALDTARYALGRLGPAGAVGAALIVAALAYHAAVVRPEQAALERQLAQNEQARRNAEAQRAQAVTEAAAGGAGQPTLAPAAAAALRRLFDTAAKNGLELAKGEYRLSVVRDAGLQRYQLSLPVAGGYPEIRAFVAQALNADPALALAGIKLKRDRIESPDLEPLISFPLYLELGA